MQPAAICAASWRAIRSHTIGSPPTPLMSKRPGPASGRASPNGRCCAWRTAYLIEQIRAQTNIEVRLRSEVAAVHGDSNLTAIDIRDANSATTARHECGGLFVFIGADADTAWLPDEVARDSRGYVLTGDDVVRAGRWSLERDPYLLEASLPGLFACGDVRLSPVKRVAAAVGEGSMAIALV